MIHTYMYYPSALFLNGKIVFPSQNSDPMQMNTLLTVIYTVTSGFISLCTT